MYLAGVQSGARVGRGGRGVSEGPPEDAVPAPAPSRNSERSRALTLIRRASCGILRDPLKRLDAPPESISPRSSKNILTAPFRVIFRFSAPGDLLSRLAGFPHRCIFFLLIFCHSFWHRFGSRQSYFLPNRFRCFEFALYIHNIYSFSPFWRIPNDQHRSEKN